MILYSDAMESGVTVCIGMFDGVHRGHQALIAVGRAVADRRHEKLMVLTFDPHPLYVLKPEIAPPMITSLPQRTELLKRFGVDHVVVRKFTQAFSELSSAQFIEEILVGELTANAVIVGENFTFGHRASGTIDTLRSLAEPHGVEVHGVSLMGGVEPISSSRIRASILGGDVESATQLLGHGFSLSGTVVRGDRRGRELGYPTINLQWDPELIVPSDGVYAGFVLHAGERLAAAISVGSNPQFEGVGRRVEAFILQGTHWDLYGIDVEIEFTQFLRPQLVFPDLDAYLAQMGVDVDRASRATQ